MYELRAYFYQVYIMRVYSSLCYILARVLLLFFFLYISILIRASLDRASIFAQNSSPYIQYVKIYRLSYSRKYS